MPDTKVVESFQQHTNGVTEQLLCNWGCMCWLKPLSWGNNHRGVWSTSRRTDEHCFLTRKEGRKHHAVGRVHACHHGGGRTEGFHCYRQVSTHGTYINRSFGFTPRTTVLLSSASWRDFDRIVFQLLSFLHWKWPVAKLMSFARVLLFFPQI